MESFFWRLFILWILLSAAIGGLVWRLFDLNILSRSFLLKQSKARIYRTVKIPVYRNIITDRLGSPLAINTPVYSVWIEPQLFKPTEKQYQKLAHQLHLKVNKIKKIVNAEKQAGHQFVWLKRNNPITTKKQIKKIHIPGLFIQDSYRRYYPEGAVTAHVVGITNIDNQGQEGIELAYNDWLQGSSGKQVILKDRLGNIITRPDVLKAPSKSHTLPLSLDRRIQYLAHQSLKKTIEKYQADSGSVVVMDIKTGEVLAMVNQPDYDPNQRYRKKQNNAYRNRAVTDIFEPGSVIKPFTIALALKSKKYSKNSIIDTKPGWMMVGGYPIHDDLNYGKVNLTDVLKKSSNIGAAKILLSLKPNQYYQLLKQFGFGERTTSAFPGEVSGILIAHRTWFPSVIATLAYGYGISVTNLQLAHAYATLGNEGVKIPVSFIKKETQPNGKRVLSKSISKTIISMLQTVIEKGGTGTRANVPGYTIAGKTGTAYLAGKNGYDKKHYMSLFVGMAPASHPRLIVSVVIRNPQEAHFGGIVAAPLFSTIMSGALNFLNIPPDKIIRNRG